MERVISKLTILFEDPFWVGIFERETDGKYEVCKITFGVEPKDYEVYNFFMKNWSQLRLSYPVDGTVFEEKHINPKRMQRKIKKQIQNIGIGTKAQQTLKLQQEQAKLERKARTREQRNAEKERQFELHQAKRKKKHRGR